MTKTKPESDFFILRPKRDNLSRLNEMSFSICRNKEDLDMTGYVYLKTKDNGMEEWVHEDDYPSYHEEMHKHDKLKEWNGSEDHKEFLSSWK